MTYCCLITLAFSQTMTLHPYGVSPREAGLDEADIFDVRFNGLPNVGVETKMYLAGVFVDSFLTSATWSIDSAPGGSVATLGTPTALGTEGEVLVFTPDVVGKYVISITEGDYSTSLTINAGTYLGGASCSGCHSGKANAWEMTGHSDILVRGLNGTLSSHYGESCLDCHTTGIDPNAANDGFGDFGFVWPDSATLVDTYGSTDGHLFDGLYDLLAAAYPSDFGRANIQCEACHGPGSAHYGATADAKMVSSLDSKDCAFCHDDGHYHVFPEQWDASVHAALPNGGYAGGRSGCSECHSGSGFIAWADGSTEIPEVAPITCVTCHEPHSVDNVHQIRLLADVVLGNGEVVTGGGNGQLCMNCHKSRRDAEDYTSTVSYSSHYGPHHGPQADMLLGTNVPSFGKNLPSSPHFQASEDACVTCHMVEGMTDAEGHPIPVGAHTFAMVSATGEANVSSCEGCHGDIGESFMEKKFYMDGMADHDGDGVEEGLQEEVHGMLEELAMMLPPYDVAEVDISGTYEYTVTEAKAAYNWFFVEEDRSGGIHNPAFAVSLLKVSMQAIMNNAIDGEIVSIEDVPNDQGNRVRIVWDKFVDDGVAVDPVDMYVVKRFDGDDAWTNVGVPVMADGSPRYALQVGTLYNAVEGDTAWAEFKVVAIAQSGMAHESLPGTGFSIDNLIPHPPVNVLASVAGQSIDIAWEAPEDTDIQYYQVYRSTTSGFPLDEASLVTETTDLTFTDASMDFGTYYYVVTAVDFNGNIGEPSVEATAEILSVDAGILPIEYALSQNYPNPFNPVTTINFSLPENGKVQLTVYNAMGQVVDELVNRNMEVGHHSITFRADHLPSGVYFYTITSNNFIETRKMVLLK